MSLLSLSQASLAYGHHALLDHADFSLLPQERLVLIGRNGAGKSSLLKVLAGLEPLDDGLLQRQTDVRIAYIAQEPALDTTITIYEQVKLGLSDVLTWIDQYSQGLGDLAHLQTQIELQDGWNWAARIDETLAQLGLDGSRRIADLSGGQRKRVALAQGLVSRPQVLLLDEPTNHLDMPSIIWLQELLCQYQGSCIVITHDRSFMDAVATRIVALDRGQLLSYPGNYSQYRITKAAQLAQEQVERAKADKLLAQEEIWIRKGVEARRTRSQSRIARLEQLRQTRQARREALGSVKLDIDAGSRSGKIVADLQQVCFAHPALTPHQAGLLIVDKLDLTVLRGDKLALIGPNGAGKTTLLKLILGQLAPSTGTVRLGSNIEVAYYDQMRDQVNDSATLVDFISPGSEWIEIGKERKHVMSYLSDFLFDPARANAPVSTLSGGERNRLLLARLFARPANVLVLDEPTNDLDIDTLELLEELLQTYTGTVLLVSHDRSFLNNVVTSVLAYEGKATWREYTGDVDDWLTQSARSGAGLAAWKPPQNSSSAALSEPTTPITPSSPQTTPTSVAESSATSLQNHSARSPNSTSTPQTKPRKLSYKDQRELDELPDRIAQLEAEQAAITKELANGALFQTDYARALQLTQRHEALDDALLTALERWEQLST